MNSIANAEPGGAPIGESDVALAIALLDDPNWSLADPEINRLRERENEPVGATTGRAASVVNSRELRAIAVIAEGTMAETQRIALMTKYLGHRNGAVQVRAAASLVRRGARSTFGDIRSRAGGWSIESVHGFVAQLLNCDSAQEFRELARSMLGSVLRLPQGHQVPVPSRAALTAVRVLIHSPSPEERELINRAAVAFPDEALLWAAVARVGPSDAAKAKARSVFNDMSRPEHLRTIAQLAFGKGDPQAISEVVASIRAYVSEFGQMDNIDSPPVAKRFSDGRAYLAALRELPDETIAAEFETVLKNGVRMRGVLLPILARRAPVRTLQWLKGNALQTEEAFRTAYLIAELRPELEGQCRELVPAVEWSRLDNEVAR